MMGNQSPLFYQAIYIILPANTYILLCKMYHIALLDKDVIL